MKKQKDIFLKDSEIAFDLKHRKTILYNISKHDASVKQARLRYFNLELAKARASFLKSKVVSNLSGYLSEFEKNAQKNGIEVFWAQNANEAVNEVLRIIETSSAKSIVKSKSMISEEINLNEKIEKSGARPIETDLGEFIVQVAGEKPYHILTPAMHKSKEDVAELFHNKFNLPEGMTPEEITRFVRKTLRREFISADIGITGANFLISDTGSVGLTENEGNGMMTVSFPKIHIVISGVEKIIPSFSDLALFVPLLAACGTGQQVSVYNSVLSGPAKSHESTGPEKMVVILLDNSRSNLASHERISESLKCLRCGACLNACPIYKNVGGYAYNTTYSGPIGSVITPHLRGFRQFGHLSFACSLCGACAEVCPVKIPLPLLLLFNRKMYVESHNESFAWNAGMKIFASVYSKRKYVNRIKRKMLNRLIPENILGKQKQFPKFVEKAYDIESNINNS